jgi:hypothetical protein
MLRRWRCERVRWRLISVGGLGKHVRSCIVYTWDHKSSAAFWAGMKVYVFGVVDGIRYALEYMADLCAFSL